MPCALLADMPEPSLEPEPESELLNGVLLTAKLVTCLSPP
jgi:hypothetical protein